MQQNRRAYSSRLIAIEPHTTRAKTPQANTVLHQQIAVTDRTIDALVYELYGLAEEEIAVVESSGT